MRHKVNKAKLYTINKLIRESRRLKIKNGSEEQKKKYNRKAERFMEEVLAIKKLKADEVSKFALCNTKMLNDIIADPAASLNDRALARISSQPTISTCVTQFHTKFPMWNHIVPQLILKLGNKKARKQRNKKLKTCENVQKKVTECSKEKICTNSNICGQDQTLTPLNSDAVHITQNEDKQQKIPVVEEKTPKDINKKINMEIVGMDTDSSTGFRNEIKIANGRLAEVKRFTEHLKAQNNIQNDNMVDVNSMPVSPFATTVDPFFVSEDGKTEYLTSASIREEIDTHKEGKQSRHPACNKNEERRFFEAEKRKNVQEQNPKNANFKTFQQRQPVNNPGNRSKQSSFTRQKMNVLHHNKKKLSVTADNDGPVHPSWEAKKKLKEQQCSVFAFKGKKIKFDD